MIRPGGQSDQLSTSEFSFSSVLGRVCRSSPPPFQTKCHAQELAAYTCVTLVVVGFFFHADLFFCVIVIVRVGGSKMFLLTFTLTVPGGKKLLLFLTDDPRGC